MGMGWKRFVKRAAIIAIIAVVLFFVAVASFLLTVDRWADTGSEPAWMSAQRGPYRVRKVVSDALFMVPWVVSAPGLALSYWWHIDVGVVVAAIGATVWGLAITAVWTGIEWLVGRRRRSGTDGSG